MIRPIVRMGDAGLLAVACAVADPGDAEVRPLVDDMVEAMRATAGAGLAAPQIGVGLRVIVFGLEASERYPGEARVQLTALVNPWIERISAETQEGWEGCLSIPGLRGLVPRWAHTAMAAHSRAGGRYKAGRAASMPASCSTRSITSTASFTQAG